MSNIAELYTTGARPFSRSRNSPNAESRFVARASFHLPVSWLSFYIDEDLHMVAESFEMADYLQPLMICSVGRGLERLLARKDAILRVLPQTPWTAIEEMIVAIRDADQPYLVLDATDVGTDSEPNEWAQKLKIMTTAFTASSAHPTLNNGWSCYFHYFPLPENPSPDISYFVGDDF